MNRAGTIKPMACVLRANGMFDVDAYLAQSPFVNAES